MRFIPSEVTPQRLAAAAGRRIADLPHRLAWRATREASANRARLARFRDRHRGERCFILANGPSLSRMDLSPLRREFTFGMNRIYLLFSSLGFRPTYYTCTNELVLEQFRADILSLPMPRFLNWNRRRLFSAGEDLMFLRPGYTWHDAFEADVRRTISSGGTVTYAALQLAYYMGFREVILLGLDHRFAVRGTPNSIAVRGAAPDADHFHPDYFPPGVRFQLPDLRRSELAYALARQAFERAGGRVLDATAGGQCTVFPKVEYGSLFG
jgi:hypothetical protein